MANETLQIFTQFDTKLNEIQLIFIIIEVIIGSVTIIGSVIVLSLYISHHVKTKEKKISHIYFISLAAADLLQGIVTAPLAIYVSFGVKINDEYCLESIAIAVTTIFISLFLMVGMSLDRYFAIREPLKYKSSVSEGITYAIILSSWIGGILVGIGLYFTANISNKPETLCFVHTERTSLIFNIVSAGFIVLPCILLFLFIYLRIYQVILKALSSTASHSNKLLELGKIVIRKNTKKDFQANNCVIKIREVRATLILFITIVLFLLSWVPGLILLIILRIFPNCSSLIGTLAVYALAQLNSMVNPFLYARNIKNSCDIIKSWFKCICCGCKIQKLAMESSSSS